MNHLRLLPALAPVLFTSALLASSLAAAREPASASPMIGAWRIDGETERVMIITPNYWTQAIYQRAQPEFQRTFGGSYSVAGKRAEGRIEFDSAEPERVGELFSVETRAGDRALTLLHGNGNEEVWTRLDEADSPLAGTWRITGRHVNGDFREMPLRARRTLKILSGTRFQWIAMNIETGEFSGTGGGSYTFRDGKYIEHIEFFSRDNSRVGAALEFDGEVEGDNWQHRGLSSRGDPIHEVWTRFEPEKRQGTEQASGH